MLGVMGQSILLEANRDEVRGREGQGGEKIGCLISFYAIDLFTQGNGCKTVFH